MYPGGKDQFAGVADFSCYDLVLLRASIKLLTKMIIAVREVIIITDTLAIARLSDLPIEPVRGLIKPIRINRVSTTAI